MLLQTVLISWMLFPSLGVKYAEYEDDSKASFWLGAGQATLRKALNQNPNTNKAKNIIVFIGDGMGVPTVTASRIYKGQTLQKRGEESVLAFEDFPHVGLVKTYNVDRQVPDSAGTATAIFTGVKTNFKTLGLSAKAEVGNCVQSKEWHIDGLLTWAQNSGRSTGIVTTTRITHATPAALYAHTPHRDWESDAALPVNTSECKDIARQLVEDEPGRNLNVIFGGGRVNFQSSSHGGNRKDGLDLIDAWKNPNELSKRSYVSSVSEMRNVNPEVTDQILGLFSKDHLSYELDRRKKADNQQPSLEEMTESAIKILQKNPQGFFLHVEGGRIDHAHHDNNAKRAFEDTLAFENAIKKALSMTESEETLVIVTADHSHVMTINGYPVRGTNILGHGDVSDKDKLPYTTIMYTTGPGYDSNSTLNRSKLQNTISFGDNYKQLTLIPMSSETHGGEDVAVYAQGPYAHLFQGVIEQNYIAHAISFASCMGPKDFLKMCEVSSANNANSQRNYVLACTNAFLLLLAVFHWK